MRFSSSLRSCVLCRHRISRNSFSFRPPSQTHTTKENFFSDPSTYPLIVIMGTALTFMVGMGFNALTYKDVTISPEKRNSKLQTWGTGTCVFSFPHFLPFPFFTHYYHFPLVVYCRGKAACTFQSCSLELVAKARTRRPWRRRRRMEGQQGSDKECWKPSCCCLHVIGPGILNSIFDASCRFHTLEAALVHTKIQ